VDANLPAFRAELGKAFRHDIPLKERDDWEAYLAAAKPSTPGTRRPSCKTRPN
jgi:hypothetical protein